jgi:hypothetical protein
VGGLTSFATTYFTQRNQVHRDLVSRDVARREELYFAVHQGSDELVRRFIGLENPGSLIGMYSLVGRMRLFAGDTVLLAAEKMAEMIVDSYKHPPRTFEDLYKFARERRIDPLKEFTEACREERMVILNRL